jgi:exosortase/archaeosortase family protein
VFVAFLFSASLVSRPRARAVVIVAAAPLALAMNFIRSLGLTLLANARVDISGFWHDATGFAVLGVTAALLGGLAVGLGAEAPDRPPGGRPASPVSPSRSRAAQASLAAILALAAALVSFYGARTHPVVRRDSSGPDLQAMLPGAPPGWTAFDAHDLSQYSGVLQTDLLSQRVYVSGAGDSRVQVTLYMAYWPPGRIPVSTVDAHTPDACWPAEGWLAKALANPEAGFSVGSRQLAPAEARVFTSMGAQQYVWFWHLYAGRPIPYQNPYSLRELASSAWHYGFRRGGDQLFVSVASNRPWDEIADLAILRQFFANTQPLGL